MAGSKRDPPVMSSRIRGPSAWCTRAKTRRAGIPAGAIAQHDVGGDERAEDAACEPAAPFDLTDDPLMDQIEELRHAGEDRDPARLERAEQRRGADGLQEDDPRADRQRQPQVRHLGERVEQRENAEDDVVLVRLDDGQDRRAFRLEIAVREHDPLGVGRRAGGVQDDRRVAKEWPGDCLRVS